MKNERIIEIICALLVGIFIYAATSKLFNFPLFVAQLNTHPYLKPFAGLVAWIVPVTELLISLLLLIPSIRKMGLYGSAALLIIFTIYICSMLLSGKPLPCSCGGFISTLNWREHLGFNGVLILLTLIGIRLYRSKKSNYKMITKDNPVGQCKICGFPVGYMKQKIIKNIIAIMPAWPAGKPHCRGHSAAERNRKSV